MEMVDEAEAPLASPAEGENKSNDRGGTDEKESSRDREPRRDKDRGRAREESSRDRRRSRSRDRDRHRRDDDRDRHRRDDDRDRDRRGRSRDRERHRKSRCVPVERPYACRALALALLRPRPRLPPPRALLHLPHQNQPRDACPNAARLWQPPQPLQVSES